MKRCTKCKIEKDINCFGNDSKAADGLRFCCKECNNAAARLWGKQNPERAHRMAKEWAIKNPDRRKVIAKRYRNKRYQQNRQTEIKRVIEYQKRNPMVKSECDKRYGVKARAQLKNAYVVGLLNSAGIGKDVIMSDTGLIDLKRAIVKYKRIQNEKRKKQ